MQTDPDFTQESRSAGADIASAARRRVGCFSLRPWLTFLSAVSRWSAQLDGLGRPPVVTPLSPEVREVQDLASEGPAPRLCDFAQPASFGRAAVLAG